MSIIVQNLSKNFGSQKAVNQISFAVNQGQITGFLGPNGAGKSTTLKMITGYIPADSGSIEVCGIPVTIDGVLTKHKIGYLPESNPLYSEMYIREYLCFVAEVYKVKAVKKRVEEVIQLIGLSKEVNKKIAQLSKGYKQRVGIAAALVHDPEVLILDEPTSGLDPNQILEIREIIKNLGKQKTVLFSSHIMQEIEAVCDNVIIINKGEIVANDKLSNLQKVNNETHAVSVEFKEKVSIDMLKQITDVNSVHQIRDSFFTFDTNNPESVRRQLLAFSLDKQLNIISLNSETKQLEDIFKLLTK